MDTSGSLLMIQILVKSSRLQTETETSELSSLVCSTDLHMETPDPTHLRTQEKKSMESCLSELLSLIHI